MSTVTSTRPLTLDDLRETPTQGGNDGAFESDSLLAKLLQEQQQLTAVEEFSRVEQQSQIPEQARYYSKLMPATSPEAGQQFAFEVDLDRCSGCKACVTACHALNGLDETETWRDVGLLVGGSDTAPVLQHVTTACHHCLEPGCLIACPVDAYEKDPVTGIVKHLDDQCFGCQYCTLACPYNVPKYHAKKGIVRKCDMCSDRLAHGEAPACVQACPHEAISIRIVDVEAVRENAEVDSFLPAAPEPHLTFPTTTYRTNRIFPKNTLPADYYSISPQHPHWPLIIMLVLTQLSVGTLATECVLEQWMTSSSISAFRPWQATTAVGFGLLAITASVLHLGRPLYAFRGIIGLRHSWLSREILAFGVFAGLSVLYAASGAFGGTDFFPIDLSSWMPWLGIATVLAGVVGVFCSAMIYAFTKREFWDFERTMPRFTLTSILLGLTTTWLTLTGYVLWVPSAVTFDLWASWSRPLAELVILVSVLKLGFDAILLRHLLQFRNSPLKQSARLLVGPLQLVSIGRVALGVLGGLLLPALWLEQFSNSPTSLALESLPIGTAAVIAVIWGGCLAGELLERYLFFAAVAAPRMPGGIRP